MTTKPTCLECGAAQGEHHTDECPQAGIVGAEQPVDLFPNLNAFPIYDLTVPKHVLEASAGIAHARLGTARLESSAGETSDPLVQAVASGDDSASRSPRAAGPDTGPLSTMTSNNDQNAGVPMGWPVTEPNTEFWRVTNTSQAVPLAGPDAQPTPRTPAEILLTGIGWITEGELETLVRALAQSQAELAAVKADQELMLTQDQHEIELLQDRASPQGKLYCALAEERASASPTMREFVADISNQLVQCRAELAAATQERDDAFTHASLAAEQLEAERTARVTAEQRAYLLSKTTNLNAALLRDSNQRAETAECNTERAIGNCDYWQRRAEAAEQSRISATSAWTKATEEMAQETERAEAAERELRSIDQVLARRPALDKPTRVDNILHAIDTASRADAAERKYLLLTEQHARAIKDLYKEDGETPKHVAAERALELLNEAITNQVMQWEKRTESLQSLLHDIEAVLTAEDKP